MAGNRIRLAHAHWGEARAVGRGDRRYSCCSDITTSRVGRCRNGKVHSPPHCIWAVLGVVACIFRSFPFTGRFAAAAPSRRHSEKNLRQALLATSRTALLASRQPGTRAISSGLRCSFRNGPASPEKYGMAMNWKDVIRAWGKTLTGGRPSLSIEITRECPLRCTGCYAYEEGHVAAGLNLRQLQDKKGEALVNGILEIVDEYRPLHLSLVGGDPLVRFRELCVLLPLLAQRGIHVQVVTSAFREIPKEWAEIPRLNLVVSVDGLQAEHDIRRRPATYDRILQNILGHHVSIHCTITGQMMKRKGYLEDFLAFWTPRTEIKRVWFSIFTPQKGATDPEILSPSERLQTVHEMLRLRR